ncbi:caspase family protein [Myxococcaceae bacterium JPH2]|nr:caspase family protein [Myxococcaceae bacterium JPH2]
MRGLALLVALWSATAAAEAEPVRRLALLVGVNDGGPGRTRLQYAATDARAFAQVLGELGGVAASDRVLLLDVDRQGLLAGFDRVRRLAEGARDSGALRVEVLLYYSGHSDEEGLLLQGQRVDYGELRRALDALPADVRIAVLDSCASGAFARRKGGVARPAFLVDVGNQVKGHAILTSSSESEASQESDRLGGSYFTHNLVSGLRGAADATHDGRVTLTEAYQFAFHETLARTERTQGGAQHPAYDIELAGTGDLVMTDLRATSAGLVLTEPLEGRLYVRDAAGTLVVEVQKTPGRLTELGLAPGRYTARRELSGTVAEAAFVLRDNARTPLAPADFVSVPGELTALRGGPAPAGELASAGLRVRLPVNLSLVPSVSTNAVAVGSAPVENRLALGVVNGGASLGGGLAIGLVSNWYDAESKGVMLAGAVNVASGEMAGAQLSLFTNVAGARLRGFQGTFGVNYAGDDVGVVGQLAGGVNVARRDFEGFQGASVLNYVGGDAWGFQAALGFNHVKGSMQGFQGALGINSTKADLTGVQAAMGLNRAEHVTGGQVAMLNVASEVTGIQLGLINVAAHVTGTQVGLINLSDRMTGVPLGLLSIEREGQFHVEVWSSDIQLTNLGLKFGGRYLYTTLIAGMGPDDRLDRFSLGIGLGGHIPVSERFWVDVDVAAHAVTPMRKPFEDSVPLLGQVRAMVGFQVLPRLAVFAGPTYNVFATWDETPDFQSITTMRVHTQWDLSTRLQNWPGFQVGLRL